VVGGVRFYERREVRDALAYLRVLSNPEDTVSLRRILNVPRRGIGDRAEEAVALAAEKHRISFATALRRAARGRGATLATRSQRAIAGFVDMLDELRSRIVDGEPVAELLESVLARTGLHRRTGGERDPQDESGWRTCRAGHGGPRVRRDAAADPEAVERRSSRGCRRRARSPRSWSGSRWSPTPTRSRTAGTGWSP